MIIGALLSFYFLFLFIVVIDSMRLIVLIDALLVHHGLDGSGGGLVVIPHVGGVDLDYIIHLPDLVIQVL